MVRAKFRVDSITRTQNGGHTVALTPVTTGSEENKQFYKYTPYGNIALNTINDAALRAFGDPGDLFYVDFTPAETVAEQAALASAAAIAPLKD